MDLSVTIVSYNTRDLLEKCLASLYQYTQGVDFEVIVVDNASSDGSGAMVQEKFPKVEFIQNRDNRFFAKAQNQAMAQAKGRICVMLNPDLYFKENALKKLVDFMDAHPQAEAAGARILNPDGSPQGSGDYLPGFLYGLFEVLLLNTLWPSNPVKAHRTRSGWNRDRTEPVEEIGGACFAVRSSLFQTIGKLDEGYLMYWEEIDWCKRILDSGSKVYYVSEAEVVHFEGASIKQLGRERKERIFYASMLRYYRKHFGFAAFFSLKLILNLFTFPTLRIARALKGGARRTLGLAV